MKKRREPQHVGRGSNLALLLLLPAATLAAYWPSVNGGILWDDLGHLTRPDLQSLHGLWRIWFEIGATQQYYPVLHSAFWLEQQLWGDAMLGYHLANVAFHSASAVVLVLILRRLALRGALVAGFIFALHPVAVESVAWISEQKNTLSALLYLASAYVYLRWDAREATSPEPEAGSPELYWTATALFVLALLAKSVTATLPAALLLVAWWRRGTLSWQRDVRPLLPWFALSAIGGTVTIWFERELIGASGDEFELSWLQRVLLAGRVIWFYLEKLVWPQNLTFIYPRWSIDPSEPWQWTFTIAAIVLGAALAVLARHYRGPLAGYLYFCGTLVPVLGFVNVYPFRFSFVADHFQYLAAIGVIVPVAAALTMAFERTGAAASGARSTSRAPFPVAVTVSVLLVAVLGASTWTRSAVYRDAETLYRDTIARNPAAWMAYQNLGTEFAARERFVEAIAAFEGALDARPDYLVGKRNLALAHLRRSAQLSHDAGTARQAIEHLRAAVRLDPDLAEAHFRLANLLSTSDRTAAVRHYEAAVRADPTLAEAHLNLGSLLSEMPGRLAGAIEQYERALEARPDYFQAHYNLGTLLMDVPARRAEAGAHLEHAVRLAPDSIEARVNLGMLLADEPARSAEAIGHLEFALARRPDLAPVREVVARLHALQR